MLKIALAVLVLLCIVLSFELWLMYQRNLDLKEQLWNAECWIDPITAVTDELDFPYRK